MGSGGIPERDMARYRAAVIGLGRMGSTYDDEVQYGGTVYLPYCHGPSYFYSPHTDLVAGADPHEEQRSLFGQRWGLSDDHLYADYREMLDAERPDFVSVATTAKIRAPIVQNAASSSAKAIWAEKPIAFSLAEAYAMVDACRENGVEMPEGGILMQQVRLWEVVSDAKLHKISSDQISLEERLEEWLANDISVLAPELLVIGRQVRTDFAGTIDLLCLDSAGDTVVVELKKGQTPREVAAQVLDYASWVRDLSHERLTTIANDYLRDSDSLASAFQKRFEKPLPEELNLEHRSLIVAESVDGSTGRIVRYLSSMNVPINVATVQHFKDKTGRSILAQVYLIEPEEAEAKSQPPFRRASRETVNGLQALADANGIGDLYAQMRNSVRGILSAQPYSNRVWYRLRLDDGGVRTVVIVDAVPHEGKSGMGFRVHATRFNELLGIGMEEVRTWLPPDCHEEDVSGWAGSSEEEKREARGLRGFFQSAEEVDKFVDGLT